MPRSGLNAHSWRRTVLSKLAIDLAWDHSGCKPDWHLELIGPQRKRRDRTTILFRVEKLQPKNPFFQKAAGNGISILAYPCGCWSSECFALRLHTSTESKYGLLQQLIERRTIVGKGCGAKSQKPERRPSSATGRQMSSRGPEIGLP